MVTLYTLRTNKVAYRARRDELVALVVTDMSCSSRRTVSNVLHSTCDTAHQTFSNIKMHGLDSVSWRVVKWCNKCNLGLYVWVCILSYIFSRAFAPAMMDCSGVLIGHWAWLCVGRLAWLCHLRGWQQRCHFMHWHSLCACGCRRCHGNDHQ